MRLHTLLRPRPYPLPLPLAGGEGGGRRTRAAGVAGQRGQVNDEAEFGLQIIERRKNGGPMNLITLNGDPGVPCKLDDSIVAATFR